MVLSQNLEQAIDKLKSIHESDSCIAEVVAFGKSAIPVLSALLFEREPSGLFQIRVRAVEALAALGAHRVLIDYLDSASVAADPVEALGNDAVLNAVARKLAAVQNKAVFDLLMRHAERPCLTGVIGALGSFKRPEAIPLLINALEEDGSRRAAEAALEGLGRAARSALLAAAWRRTPSPQYESESSRRRRRSALRLLTRCGSAYETPA